MCEDILLDGSYVIFRSKETIFSQKIVIDLKIDESDIVPTIYQIYK